MNCDKDYEYEVIGLLLAKVDQETGEEVLNKFGETKLFKHLNDNLRSEYMDFSEESVEEIRQWLLIKMGQFQSHGI